MNYVTSILHGIIICIPFSIFVLISFLWHPRLWLHSLPKDIAGMVAPKTNRERMLTRYLLLPIYLLILPGLSVASVVYLSILYQTDYSYLEIFIHIYIIWITVHLWDLLIIDGLFLLLINPCNPPIRGSEGAKGWKDFGFHFREFLRATFMSALFVVPAAAILAMVL